MCYSAHEINELERTLRGVIRDGDTVAVAGVGAFVRERHPGATVDIQEGDEADLHVGVRPPNTLVICLPSGCRLD